MVWTDACMNSHTPKCISDDFVSITACGLNKIACQKNEEKDNVRVTTIFQPVSTGKLCNLCFI